MSPSSAIKSICEKYKLSQEQLLRLPVTSITCKLWKLLGPMLDAERGEALGSMMQQLLLVTAAEELAITRIVHKVANWANIELQDAKSVLEQIVRTDQALQKMPSKQSLSATVVEDNAGKQAVQAAEARCNELLKQNQELRHQLENLARQQHSSYDEQKALKTALRRQEAGRSKAVQQEKMLYSKLLSDAAVERRSLKHQLDTLRSETHNALMQKQQEIDALQRSLTEKKQQLAVVEAAIAQQLDVLGRSTTQQLPVTLPEQIQLLASVVLRKAENERDTNLQLQAELLASKSKHDKLEQAKANVAKEAGDLLQATRSQLSATMAELDHAKNENTLLKNQMQQLEELLHTTRRDLHRVKQEHHELMQSQSLLQATQAAELRKLRTLHAEELRREQASTEKARQENTLLKQRLNDIQAQIQQQSHITESLQQQLQHEIQSLIEQLQQAEEQQTSLKAQNNRLLLQLQHPPQQIDFSRSQSFDSRPTTPIRQRSPNRPSTATTTRRAVTPPRHWLSATTPPGAAASPHHNQSHDLPAGHAFMVQQVRRLAKENRELRQKCDELSTQLTAKSPVQYDGDVCQVVEMYSTKVEELQRQLEAAHRQEALLRQSVEQLLLAQSRAVVAEKRHQEAERTLAHPSSQININEEEIARLRAEHSTAMQTADDAKAKLVTTVAEVKSLQQVIQELEKRCTAFENEAAEIWRLLHPSAANKNAQPSQHDESIRAIQQLQGLVSSTQQRCTLLATQSEKLQKLLQSAHQQIEETTLQAKKHAVEAVRMSARNDALEEQLKQVPDDIQVAISERRILEAEIQRQNNVIMAAREQMKLLEERYQAELQEVIASEQAERRRLMRVIKEGNAATPQPNGVVSLTNRSRSRLFESFDSEDGTLLMDDTHSTDRRGWSQNLVSSFDLNISNSEARLQELHLKLTSSSDLA